MPPLVHMCYRGEGRLLSSVQASLPKRAEMMRITEIWVETAMQLGGKALGTMERLVALKLDAESGTSPEPLPLAPRDRGNESRARSRPVK